MTYRISEQKTNLRNKSIPRVDPVQELQTRIWLESIFRRYHLNRYSLQKVLNKGVPSDGVIFKWLRGVHVASLASANKVETLLPNSSKIYKLPLFTLLRNQPLKKSKLLTLMEPYLSDRSLPMWDLPNSKNGEDRTFATPYIFLQDSDALFQRGDLYGFQCILFLMRMAEVKNDQLMYLHYLKDAYKALPGLCRYRYFTSRWGEFLNAMIGLQTRMPLTTLLVKPNKNIIKEQIENKKHITFRAFRPRDPKTFRFIELQKTYHEATFE